jgi:hypothetical protein
MIRPELFYTKTPECIIVLFNSRYPGTEERLQRKEGAWCGFAHIEKLAEGRSALITRPGGATRLAS